MREVLLSKANFRPNACVAEVNNLTDSSLDFRREFEWENKGIRIGFLYRKYRWLEMIYENFLKLQEGIKMWCSSNNKGLRAEHPQQCMPGSRVKGSVEKANIHSLYVRIPDKGITMNNCHTFSVCQDPGRIEGDSVADTASYVPAVLVQSERGESTGGQENAPSRRANVPPAKASEGKRQTHISSPAAPRVVPNLLSDLAFLEHIIRVVAARMAAGEEDAKIAGHWMRKVERVIEQMGIPEETKVDCVSQLLTESAHSWWETIRGRRVGEVLRWRDFREEFEERYYSWEHRKEKEQEFLNLKQGDMTVLEYEKRFPDLTPFASTYLPTERHMVDRFRDGLRQELKMILMAMQLQSVRDLVRAAQGIERVMRDTTKPVVEQGQMTGFKRRDSGFSSGRTPFPKKGKNAQMLGQFQKRGGNFTHGSSSGGFR
uniref:Retrotransposon gag domain-containing protein n=1 Tax=Salix viminalis TaxID=40686 RepID=A0A6N2NCS8_SALVM